MTLKEIILNPNIKKRCEQFNAFFKKLEECSRSSLPSFTPSLEYEPRQQQSVKMSATTSSAIKWVDVFGKQSVPLRPSKAKSEQQQQQLQQSVIDTVLMSQEKRMKQVIDTYNQAVRIKWRPEGSRTRPSTANPKNSNFSGSR